MTRAAALFVTVLALLVMPSAAAATAHTENASLGQVSARLTYDQTGDGFSNVRLAIFRASAPLLDYAVGEPCPQLCLTRPGGAGTRRSVDGRQLDGDSEPEVILDINTGGAHCCDWAYVYSFVPAQDRYVLTRRDFGDPGYRLVELGKGRPVGFLGFDYRFAYAFTDYADSEFPPQLFHFANRTFVDETRRHPDTVRADAKRLLREYRRYRGRRDVRGILAAYVADSSLLGPGRAAFRNVRKALKRRDVRRLEFDSWPTGSAYLRTVRKYLKEWGYTR
jgi:hypothetical protein